MGNKKGLFKMFTSLFSANETSKLPTVEEALNKLKRRDEAAKVRQKRNQGLTRYFFDKNHLWALNEKNATEKALKLGWIKPLKK
jgi:hypothetical protein